MKNNTFLYPGLAIICLSLPLITNGQSRQKDSIGYDGKYMKIEMVNVRMNSEVSNEEPDDNVMVDTNAPADETGSTTRKQELYVHMDVPQTIDNDSGSDDSGHHKSNPNATVVSRFFVMDIGFNNMLNGNNETKMPVEYKDLKLNPSKSVNFHLGIFQQGIRLDKQGKLRLVYGVGVEYNNYHFVNDVDLIGNQDELTYAINDDVEYRKNKVVTQYATIPLMLNYKSKPGNEGSSFNLAAGVQGGYLFRTHQKQKWDESGDRQKRKTRSDYNFEEVRYGYVVQFGYGNFNLYAKYYPTPVFRKDEGPEMNTVAMGLVLMPF